MALKFNKLTRAAIKALKPGEKIEEHAIAAQRLSNGDVRYTVNLMVDGRRFHRVVGNEAAGVTRQQAEDYIAALKTKAREERLDLPTGRKLAISFEKAGKQYIERLEKEGGKSVDRKARILSLHLNPALGTKPLTKITSSDLTVYRQRRRGLGASDATINRELAVVSHMFPKGIEWGWIKDRPTIPRAKEGSGRIGYLDQSECARVIACAKEDISPHVHAFTVIALSTGMRMGEILSIRIEDIDLIKKRIFIPKAKAGSRDQPITSDLAVFLQSYIPTLPPKSEWLFPNPKSKSGHLATIRKAHRRVIVAAGLDPNKVVRHTMRHTAITHLVQAGVDLPTVQKISGHKTLSMVARYAHANGSHIDTAMDRLERRISVNL